MMKYEFYIEGQCLCERNNKLPNEAVCQRDEGKSGQGIELGFMSTL